MSNSVMILIVNCQNNINVLLSRLLDTLLISSYSVSFKEKFDPSSFIESTFLKLYSNTKFVIFNV